VGGCPPDLKNLKHPGGQVTATSGLVGYAKTSGIELDIIDTTQQAFPRASLFIRLIRGGKRLSKFLSFLYKNNYDGAIIFTSASISYLERTIMAFACRIKGVKSLLLLRDGNPPQQVKRSLFWYFYYKILAKVPNWVAAQGTPWKLFYQSIGVPGERIAVIRNWLPENFKPLLAEIERMPKTFDHRLTFLFVGWMIKEKGVVELLDAYSSSDYLRTQSNLIFAGGGNETEELAKTADERELRSVKFLNWQSTEQVMALMKNSDILVLPSYLEGFPNVVLEAIASGLPVIASDVGAISDTVHPDLNGYLVKPKDVEGLRSAMEAAIGGPDKLSAMSAAGVVIIKKIHDRERNCKAVFDLFD